MPFSKKADCARTTLFRIFIEHSPRHAAGNILHKDKNRFPVRLLISLPAATHMFAIAIQFAYLGGPTNH
jgi:hypothetical protein